MILTKILLAYHISRMAPHRPEPRSHPWASAEGQHCVLRLLLCRGAVFIWNGGFMPKLGKTALVLFL